MENNNSLPEELVSKHQIVVEEAEYEEFPHSAMYRMDWVKAANSCGEITLEYMGRFADFVGDRPLPEFSKSTGQWRWWDNTERLYKYATTPQLIELFFKQSK